MIAWKILERLEGYVDTRTYSQDTWAPMFRSRRLGDGDKFRLYPQAQATLTLPDRSRLLFTAGSHYLVAAVSDYQLSIEGEKILLDLRMGRLMQDVVKILGLDSHCRFVPAPGMLPIAARG